MPAKHITKKPAPKDFKKASEIDAGTLKLFYPVLGACVLDRDDPPEPIKRAKPDRFYDTVLRLMGRPIDGINVALCEFSAGQRFKGKIILQVDATYFIAFHAGKETLQEVDRKSLFEELASTSAWPLFRDLFIHIASQSGEELPLLPNVPKLRWIKQGEEKSKKRK